MDLSPRGKWPGTLGVSAFIVPSPREEDHPHGDEAEAELDEAAASASLESSEGAYPEWQRRLADLVAERQQERVEKYIALGQEEGARLVVGGNGRPAGFDKGKLLFELKGHKLRGKWTLVKTKRGKNEWLLIKERDAYATTQTTEDYPHDSVLSGRTVEQVASVEHVPARHQIRDLVDVEPELVAPPLEPRFAPGVGGRSRTSGLER